MNTSPSRLDSRPIAWLAGGMLVLAALVAYQDSFSGPLVLDDLNSILGNPTIRHLWPLGGPLSPPHSEGMTVEGRPILNLSLAVNYAISGTDVWSYHALNLLIHVCAGLLVFGIVRRTVEKVGTGGPPVPYQSVLVAFFVALLWTVHPLQTESVTYIVQRAESLMGLFYLLTLYCFIRGAEANGRLWYVCSFLACLLGMGTKEVMVSAPAIVFLCDRTFFAGSFRAAWRRRRPLYLGLAATWLLLGWLAIRTGDRGGTSGFDVGVEPVSYWLAQFPAVVHYLCLSVWPSPLIFDYGPEWLSSPPAVWPCAVLVLGLAAATVWALWRRPALGFLGFWFFAILAPTSLMPGNRQTLAEHRMYLALVPVAVAVVLAVYRGLGRRGLAVLAAAAVALGLLTCVRNRDYRSALALYADNVAKLPTNPYAQCNLAVALFVAGRMPEAVARDEEALRLKPDYADAENNLGSALLGLGRTAEAVGHYERALRLDPRFVDTHSNLAGALARLGRFDEAAAQCREALRLRPDDVEAWNNLGGLLALQGRPQEAVACYERALRLDPDDASARANLAEVRRRFGLSADEISP